MYEFISDYTSIHTDISVSFIKALFESSIGTWFLICVTIFNSQNTNMLQNKHIGYYDYI
jgi:hypothetical protein